MTISRRATVCAVALSILFFADAAVQAQDGRSDSGSMDEMRRAVEELLVETARLRRELDASRQGTRAMSESLAVARTESELFQKRWRETRLLLELAGYGAGATESGKLLRQLAESSQAQTKLEMDRNKLIAQMERLLASSDDPDKLEVELDNARRLLAITAGGDVSDKPVAGDAAPAHGEGTLTAAAVVDVNKPLNLVVLNLGREQGVQVGMPVEVIQGNRVAAVLRVVEVRRRICGAVIVTAVPGTDLKAGDTARVAAQ
jgi:hypothetical protein